MIQWYLTRRNLPDHTLLAKSAVRKCPSITNHPSIDPFPIIQQYCVAYAILRHGYVGAADAGGAPGRVKLLPVSKHHQKTCF